MTEKKTQVITINDVEYTEDQLTDNQKMLVNHAADLDRKIKSTQFNLDQLSVGKQAFIDMLTKDLADQPEDAEVIAPTEEANES
tara:strand:+ start:2877 stop:3128 length:252 start_codon:yes stop_codon:yes gene_type:complete